MRGKNNFKNQYIKFITTLFITSDLSLTTFHYWGHPHSVQYHPLKLEQSKNLDGMVLFFWPA